MKSIYRRVSILFATFVVGMTCMGQAARAQAAPSDDAQALVKQGQKLNSEGKQDEALKLYKQALEMSPNSYEAHLELGVALDLKGDYTAASEHLKKAIEVAPADQKNRALRVMAFSYAFESNSAEAGKYEKQVFDALMAKSDFEAAAGVANELARIKLESGDIDGAANWYKAGYDTAMRKTDVKDADKNLWAFRRAHAQARIAAPPEAATIWHRVGQARAGSTFRNRVLDARTVKRGMAKRKIQSAAEFTTVGRQRHHRNAKGV